MIRIAIVNDLRIAIAALSRAVASMPDAEIAWTALDGAEAVERCRADRPDVILMDMVMPVMDGVEATRRIMAECPCPILVVTATVSGNAALVFDALGHGALDAVATPSLGAGGDLAGAEPLIRKVRTIARLSDGAASRARSEAAAAAPPPAAPRDGALPPIVAIGASTGGPSALATLLGGLPNPFPAALMVAQHVDSAFAPGLADWLGRSSGFPVAVATPGAAPQAGRCAIAATDDHLVLGTDARFAIVREPAEAPYRPSVDVLFASLVRAAVAPGVAVLLTGMGRDGAQGLLALRDAGWHTIAQDQASSVVWGMPRAAAELEAAREILPIDAIASAVARRIASPGARPR